MAEEQSQERTEEATLRRLQQAAERGQVARSRELNAFVVTLAGASALWFSSGWLLDGLGSLMQGNFRFGHAEAFDSTQPFRALHAALIHGLLMISPILLVLLVAALGGGMLVSGWHFSVQAMAFKGDRVNPISGFKRIFSMRSLVELLKGIAKFVLVAAVAIVVLWWLSSDILALSGESLQAAAMHAAFIIGLLLLLMCLPLGLIAVIDVPFQLWSHKRQLRMTRQETRDEHKETDGNPEVKSKIRATQQEMARRRMMQDVPTADVVVTNPTHVAVALRYDAGRDAAPMVVAKGTDLVALNIRRVALEHGVPLLETPPLARALNRSCDIGAAIPKNLYMAVAQVLVWVHQLQEAQRNGEPAPPPPKPQVSEEKEGSSWKQS